MSRGLRVLGAAALTVGVAAVVLAAIAGDLASVIAGTAYLAFPVVGLVIARVQPRNTVAWVYVVAALLLGVEVSGQELTTLGVEHRWPDPLVHVVAWAQSWTWVPGLFLLVTVALLRFPDGALPGRGWRWVERASYASMAGWSLGVGAATATVPTRELLADGTPHPHGFAAGALLLGESMLAVVGGCTLAALGSLLLRYRRSDRTAREQLKWVLSAAAVAILIEIVLDVSDNLLGSNADWVQSVGEGIGFTLIAVATGIAITRYKLYDIDRIVSRTVTYAVVLVLLAALYLTVVLGLADLVPAGLGQFGVAVATLLVSVAAVPLSRRVRRVVDRRFNRARFDAERIVTDFAGHLRARPEDNDIATALVDVLHRTVQPSHVGVWLVPGPTRP